VRPIDTLEPGDLVLSQDVNTGELKYEPVLARTLRPPSEIVRISINGEELRATRGHPFWVAGTGWRMAKELGDGAMLHSLSGSTGVRSIKTDGEAEAYNLVVADFNTYLVGEHGLLVHDNMPRTPTRAILPGVVPNEK
jgi:intein/homing endonuclease